MLVVLQSNGKAGHATLKAVSEGWTEQSSKLRWSGVDNNILEDEEYEFERQDGECEDGRALCLAFSRTAGMSGTGKDEVIRHNSVSVMPGAPKVKYSKMIFGQFIEHFDNQVYGGLYDPESKFADEDGFRKDVIEALREIKTPIVRWPGGCFVSTYHWLDGVGKERTPV